MSTSKAEMGFFGNWVRNNKASKEDKQYAIRIIRQQRELIKFEAMLEELEEKIQELSEALKNLKIDTEISNIDNTPIFNMSNIEKDKDTQYNNSEFKFIVSQSKISFESEVENGKDFSGGSTIPNAA